MSLQRPPVGCLRMNAARIGMPSMALQPTARRVALERYPDVQIELTNDEGSSTSSKGVRRWRPVGESCQTRHGGCAARWPGHRGNGRIPDYLRRYAAPRQPYDLVRHNCMRLRFCGSGTIYKWEFQVDWPAGGVRCQAAT